MRITKKILSAFLLLSLVFSLCSCENAISREEAKRNIEELITCLSAEEYDNVIALMHPDYQCDKALIKDLINEVEKAEGVDFSNGAAVKRYTGFRTALYDSNVGGGYYSLSGYLTVSGKDVYFKVEFARTGEEFGICNFSFGK